MQSLVSSRFKSGCAVCCLIFIAALGRASVNSLPQGKGWTLRSGDTEYRLLAKEAGLQLEYFGPAGGAAWPASPAEGWGAGSPVRAEMVGEIAGQPVAADNFQLISAEVGERRPGVAQLKLTLAHRTQPLVIQASYATWADSGVITRSLVVSNTGSAALRLDRLPSLSWALPAGAYDLTYLYGGWGRERQVAGERLAAGRREFVQARGRSTQGYSPWFSLRNETTGVRYAAQLAWSGNWEMSFERKPWNRPVDQEDLKVDLGLRFDGGGSLTLGPGQSLALPEVAFTATAGDLDDAANALHRYQREFVIPRTRANNPLLVQFNSWYPFPGKMTVAEMKRCADIAAGLGAEVFVLDAGWYNKKDWSRELGDYQADPVAFPNGVEELARHVHGRGMKFGIWVEIENLGTDSDMFRQHPDWCLRRDGQPIVRDNRHQLNFAKPEVRAWARGVLDRLVKQVGIDWVKIDYNIDAGDRFDLDAGAAGGDVLYRHVTSYYAWLDELRAAYPDLVIENCSSGGLRFDLGLLAHTHTTWLSDEVLPLPSLQLAYGSTLEFTPEVCNHWMVGETHQGEVDLKKPPGWFDFLFRVPMNGQWGISSRVFDWTPELLASAKTNVALYKRIRTVLRDADTFHLTPPPDHEKPTNWMALQYVAPDRQRSVLMAYRLAQGAAEQTFKLRGLEAATRYRLSQDGVAQGIVTGVQLAQTGVTVKLDAEWRAAVVELEATPSIR